MFKLLSAATLLSLATLCAQTSPFLEKPYLQLGDSPKLAAAESLVLLWHTDNTPADWKVEVRTSKDSKWRAVDAPKSTTVSAPGAPAVVAGKDGAKKDSPSTAAIEPHLVYRAHLTKLIPGQEFHYRVLKANQQVFESTATARKSASQKQHFVLFGDIAQATAEQNAIAYQASLTKPDFIFVTGDIVYGSGRISEYRHHFFPVYNSDTASTEAGAPLLRSVPFIAAPGNHDTALNNYRRYPDALAYFHYWDMPLNGPAVSGVSHTLTGNAEAQPAFLESTKPRYPVMANFSFDYGNAHWTVLDSNPYMDWNNPALKEWVAKDIASASGATWRFVAFHHPGINSAKEHFNDQWMRLLAPVFEAGKVDIVFAGHVHNYQRSFPLHFAPKAQDDGKWVSPKGEVAGDFTYDHDFKNGESAKPKGVIYIISGAGGAHLYNPEMQSKPETWQPFTDKFLSEKNSFSLIDIEGKTFHLKQISLEGKELDHFQIRK